MAGAHWKGWPEIYWILRFHKCLIERVAKNDRFVCFLCLKFGKDSFDTVDGNQKSGDHQLRLVVYPIIYSFFLHRRVVHDFFHQHYVLSLKDCVSHLAEFSSSECFRMCRIVVGLEEMIFIYDARTCHLHAARAHFIIPYHAIPEKSKVPPSRSTHQD